MAWNLWGGLHRIFPSAVHSWLQHQEKIVKLNFLVTARRWIEHRLDKRGHDLHPMRRFLDEVARADVVIASGGGFVTDSFERHACDLLQTLAMAQVLGKPTAMFGQGLGPVASRRLRFWAGRVLPHLDALTLREGRYSKPFALSVGVPAGKIEVTGDDAIALAYAKAPPALGNAIGVNLRVADYSGMQAEALNIVKRVLTSSAAGLGAELRPVPVSVHDSDSDLRSLQILLGDEAADRAMRMDTPEKVIEEVGRCRVVVTGSYHAGVFALSQGIGVVGVAASDYYRQKFEGLADQFAGGCRIVDREKPGFESHLKSALHESWAEAETLRPGLLAKAALQAKSGECAYDSFAEKLGHRQVAGIRKPER